MRTLFNSSANSSNTFLNVLVKKTLLIVIISTIVLIPLINGGATQENILKIESIDPSSGPQGANIQVIITGIGITEETRVFLRRGTYTINPAQTYFEQNNNAGLNLRIIFDTPINPDLIGPYNVTVWNPNGDEFVLIDGFTVVEEGMELPELNVINVSPTILERNKATWVEISGTGLVFIEDGRQVNDLWETGRPFFTILKTPEGVFSYYETRILDPDYLEIVNSTLWRVKIHVNPEVPPQTMIFTMFNPSTYMYPYDYNINDLYRDQNNPRQIDDFTLEITRREDEGEPGSYDPPSSCIIATATFGSELSPEVQFLRDFRDNTVLSTFTGQQFIEVFNRIYYSFSPDVASVIRESEGFQEFMKGVLYPLIGILKVGQSVSSILGFNSDFGIVMFCFVVSCLIGLVYFVPLTLIINFISKTVVPAFIVKITCFLWLGSVSVLFGAEIFRVETLVMLSGGAFVILSSALSTFVLSRIIKSKISTFDIWVNQSS